MGHGFYSFPLTSIFNFLISTYLGQPLVVFNLLPYLCLSSSYLYDNFINLVYEIIDLQKGTLKNCSSWYLHLNYNIMYIVIVLIIYVWESCIMISFSYLWLWFPITSHGFELGTPFHLLNLPLEKANYVMSEWWALQLHGI